MSTSVLMLEILMMVIYISFNITYNCQVCFTEVFTVASLVLSLSLVGPQNKQFLFKQHRSATHNFILETSVSVGAASLVRFCAFDSAADSDHQKWSILDAHMQYMHHKLTWQMQTAKAKMASFIYKYASVLGYK